MFVVLICFSFLSISRHRLKESIICSPLTFAVHSSRRSFPPLNRSVTSLMILLVNLSTVIGQCRMPSPNVSCVAMKTSPAGRLLPKSPILISCSSTTPSSSFMRRSLILQVKSEPLLSVMWSTSTPFSRPASLEVFSLRVEVGTVMPSMISRSRSS